MATATQTERRRAAMAGEASALRSAAANRMRAMSGSKLSKGWCQARVGWRGEAVRACALPLSGWPCFQLADAVPAVVYHCPFVKVTSMPVPLPDASPGFRQFEQYVVAPTGCPPGSVAFV